eukprot:365920-Chlamydomonas_euryale.AAC.17
MGGPYVVLLPAIATVQVADEGKVKLSSLESDDDSFKLPAGYHWWVLVAAKCVADRMTECAATLVSWHS